MVQILLRFIHISDTHYAPPAYDLPYGRYHPTEGTQALIEHLNALPYTPDFILHTGDVAYDPDPTIYAEIKQAFSKLKAPVIFLPGNHDERNALQTVLMDQPTAQPYFYHSRIMNGVKLIFLDSNGEHVPLPRGWVTDEQLTWLEAELQADPALPIVIAVHHPILPTHESEWFDDFMRTQNGEAVHELLKPYAQRIRGVFHGHVHHSIDLIRDGILYSSAQSSWVHFHVNPHQSIDTPLDEENDPGYTRVTITDQGLYLQRQHYRHA